MHDMLLFMGVWGGYLGFSAVSFAVVVWAISIDEGAQSRKVTFDLPRVVFWPLIWLYLRLIGTDMVTANRKHPSSAAINEPDFNRYASDARKFGTIREAKYYLAARIAEEAELEGTPLTEVERKMLYFTETGWTLPDMKAVSAEFDRDSDQDEYERRISALGVKCLERDGEKSDREREDWDLALERLSRGDHYLSVLVGASAPTRTPETWVKHSLKVVAAFLVLTGFGALDLWVRHWMREHLSLHWHSHVEIPFHVIQITLSGTSKRV